jgi:hypothetical protein
LLARFGFALGVLAAVGLLLGASAAAPTRSAPVRGLLVTENESNGGERVSILSLTGKRLPIPPRLRSLGYAAGQLSPYARLSPDARFVADIDLRRGSVLIGGVRGGAMRTVLRSPCPSGCLNAPTFAWSPDSRFLAVAAGDGVGKPSVLRIVDLSGRVVRSFTVPRRDPDSGEPEGTEVISWSPDGSRLLLMRTATFGATAAIVREIRTGTSRSVANFVGCDGPHLAWSPNGRFIALDSRGTQDCLDFFALIDAVRAKTLISRSWEKGKGAGGTVWAPDSKSVFGFSSTYRAGRTSSRIDRIYLSGRRTKIIKPRLGWLTPRVALVTGLVYDSAPPTTGPKTLYLHNFTTRAQERLASSRLGFARVEPLQRLP